MNFQPYSFLKNTLEWQYISPARASIKSIYIVFNLVNSSSQQKYLAKGLNILSREHPKQYARVFSDDHESEHITAMGLIY